MDDVDHANLTNSDYSTADIDSQQWAFRRATDETG